MMITDYIQIFFQMINDIPPQVLYTAMGAAVALFSVFLTNLGQRKLEKEKFERNQKFEKEKFRMNQNSEQAIFLRGKLEKLTLLYAKWHDAINLRATTFGLLKKGEIELSEVLKSKKDKRMSHIDHLQGISVIINLNFPSLRGSLNEVLDAKNKISSDFTEISVSMISAEEHSENLKNFQITSYKFITKLIECSQNLAKTD